MTSAPQAPQAPYESGADLTLRDRAIERLKKKRAFYGHVLVYVAVNAFLVFIWAITSQGFFWPAFPMAAWGIGVIMNAWDVWQSDFSEEAIDREVERLRHHR